MHLFPLRCSNYNLVAEAKLLVECDEFDAHLRRGVSAVNTTPPGAPATCDCGGTQRINGMARERARRAIALQLGDAKQCAQRSGVAGRREPAVARERRGSVGSSRFGTERHSQVLI